MLLIDYIILNHLITQRVQYHCDLNFYIIYIIYILLTLFYHFISRLIYY